MVTLDFKALTSPVGIVRLLQVLFTCVTFSLVAAYSSSNASFWAWCMFVWVFCFCITILIIILEFLSISSALPISWLDFTTAYAMLATLLVLAASIIFSAVFVCASCGGLIGATVTSFIAFILYGVEVGLTRAKPGELSGFLTTIPGLLKVLEACVAIIIFSCLGFFTYSGAPGPQWCVAVYSICFIFALVVIILTIGRLLAVIPVFDKVLCGCNIVAVLMYFTAMIIWPYYTLRGISRPQICSVTLCAWDIFVIVTFLTVVNLVAYIVDTVYSFRLVFFVSRT